MKVAIIGSRKYKNYNVFSKCLDAFFEKIGWTPTMVYSGGAKGVDEMAEKYCVHHSIPITIHYAQWKKYGKAAGPIRNELIVKNSDIILAFPRKGGKGTQNAIKIAKRHAKEVYAKWV